MVIFTGLSPKQTQAIDLLTKHISLPDVEIAVAQSDQASISIKGESGHYQLTYRNLTNYTAPCPYWQQL